MDGYAMTRRACLLVALTALLSVFVPLQANAQTKAVTKVVPAQAVSVSHVKQSPDVLMLAAAKLKSYGYSIDTPAHLDRSIRHWQKVNGLDVDGVVGPITSHSLGLDAPTIAGTVPTTAPPASTHASPSASVPAGDVEQIIRDVWSDQPPNVIEWAVKIATRESNLQPGVRNSCCIGLFQIHFYAHQAWLSDFGANSPADLFDPRINARAALALFQQAGVHPWDCHGQCRDIPL